MHAARRDRQFEYPRQVGRHAERADVWSIGHSAWRTRAGSARAPGAVVRMVRFPCSDAAMSRKRDGLTDADRADWAGYTAGIRRLGKPVPAPRGAPAPADRIEQLPRPPGTAHRPALTPTPLTIGEAPGGVDRASWERFRSGKLTASRTLDLHGLTAQQAFHAVSDFLRASQAEGIRCVEVVTGRGSRGAGGVIRREFRDWLNRPDIRALVLAAAHPHPANLGAVKVLLRRPKSSRQGSTNPDTKHRRRG